LQTCQSCGGSVPDGASFCPHCGNPMRSGAPASRTAASGGQSLATVSDMIMRKKLLSLHESYDFVDLSGAKIGEAEGNLVQLPAKISVTLPDGSELMHIQGKVLALRKQYTFYDSAGQEIGTIKKKIAKLIGEEYWVEKDGVEFMRVYGNFTEHDYQMEVDGTQVAQVHKKWITVQDQFGLSIAGQIDHRVVIGAVIAIEHVEVTERERR
jgi:uncharacterized protein YxjI